MCCNYAQIWKTTKKFGIFGVIAKTLYGYWSGHPCLVGVVGPNVARVSIIKGTRIDITCGVMINDDLPYLISLTV